MGVRGKTGPPCSRDSASLGARQLLEIIYCNETTYLSRSLNITYNYLLRYSANLPLLPVNYITENSNPSILKINCDRLQCIGNSRAVEFAPLAQWN
jgi:hypothetical protein